MILCVVLPALPVTAIQLTEISLAEHSRKNNAQVRQKDACRVVQGGERMLLIRIFSQLFYIAVRWHSAWSVLLGLWYGCSSANTHLFYFASDAFVGTDGSTQLAALTSREKDSRCSPVLSMHLWIVANQQNSSMVLCCQVLVMSP